MVQHRGLACGATVVSAKSRIEANDPCVFESIFQQCSSRNGLRMAFFTFDDARAALNRARSVKSHRTSTRVLIEESASAKDTDVFDIFLSHSIRDADIVRGMKLRLNEEGFSVYIDWIDDDSLDREQVSPETADQLRKRMLASKTLAVLTSSNTSKSIWVPWELGFFDGFKRGGVAVLPVLPDKTSRFVGQEYLGLYPTLETLNFKKDSVVSAKLALINPSRQGYILLTHFIRGVRRYTAFKTS